jgi:hypothetical protein
MRAAGDDNIAPGRYFFGGWFRNTDGTLYQCSVIHYSDPNCTGTATTVDIIDGSETAWTFRMGPLTVSGNEASVMLRCDANPNTFIDKLFLSTGSY